MKNAPRAFLPWLLTASLELSCLGGAGCDLFSPDREVTVTLPTPPEHWSPDITEIRWIMVFPDSEGRIREEPIAAPSQEIEVRLPKSDNLPLLSIPLLGKRGVRMAPAGALFPWDMTDDGRLRLSWQRGVAACILLDLVAQGIEISLLDGRRLCREIDRRSGKDPWSLDIALIRERLATGVMRVDSIKPAPGREVLISPGPGIWTLESPFRLPMEADDTGTLAPVHLPYGIHTLYCFSHPGYCRVFLNEQELVILLCP